MSPPPPPIDPSSLIFPSAHATANATFTALTRSLLSITNRLHSIQHDADFVRRVRSTYHLPLVANERCGSWYIDPALKGGSAYFKSTDGHSGEWAFSLRRLNLDILQVIGENGGCIIVDSTRRGKSMPDALCKTVPIWIAVLNRAIFPDQPASHVLSTPENIVSASEHAMIEERLPKFVAELLDLRLNVLDLRSKLSNKPMRAAWVTPVSELSVRPDAEQDWNRIVLCTASGRTVAGRPNTFTYVQGAADDHESWAQGLTPPAFWTNAGILLSASEEDLPGIITSLVASFETETVLHRPALIKPTANIWVGSNAAADFGNKGFGIVVSCAEKPDVRLCEALKGGYIHLACDEGKNGSRQLRKELPKITVLTDQIMAGCKVLLTCPTGRDLAIGAALALICLCYADDGTVRAPDSDPAFSKTLIKRRLSWLMIALPSAAPSRATLQSVNAFLLS